MSDPTAQPKLIERLRNAADWCRKVGTEDNGDLYDEAAAALTAAPGLVPLPEWGDLTTNDQRIAIAMMAGEQLHEWYRARFATPAPLAAQSHDQAIVRAAMEVAEHAIFRKHKGGMECLICHGEWVGYSEAHDAFCPVTAYHAAKRAAQSPPRGERIERSGKDRRRPMVINGCEIRKDWTVVMNYRTGKDRRAPPQSGEDESFINPMIEAYDETDCRIGSRLDFKSRARSEWMKVFIEELAKRNLRIVSNGDG